MGQGEETADTHCADSRLESKCETDVFNATPSSHYLVTFSVLAKESMCTPHALKDKYYHL